MVLTALIAAAGLTIGMSTGEAGTAAAHTAPIHGEKGGPAQPGSVREAGGPARADGEIVVRLIDARDVGLLLPVPEPAPLPKPEGGGQSPFEAPGAPARPSPLMMMVGRMAGALGVNPEEVSPGLFVVSGEAGAIDQLQAMLGTVRDSMSKEYELSLWVQAVPGSQAPAVGAARPAGGAASQWSAHVRRRTATPISIVERSDYVAHWTPIVGNSAVGYEADVQSTVSGVEMRAIVGAGPDGDGTALFLQGELRDEERRTVVSPLSEQAEARAQVIELPTIRVCRVAIDTRVGGEPRVVGVYPGFGKDTSLVISAAVRAVAK